MKRTIACLKWGKKYTPQYVNTLYKMAKRHSSLPFDFVCFTDDSSGLSPEIRIVNLPNIDLSGWWFKLFVFSEENKLDGDVLFLDLDIIIHENIDKLWSYNSSKFLIIRDFTRHINPSWKKFNSSVFRFNAQEYRWIWDEFKKDYKKIIYRCHGDQDYLYNILSERALVWPDSWIESYKWEMRDKSEIAVINGKRNFISIKNPKVDPESCIAVFHGDPNPHEVKDPWVIENWK